MSFIRNPPAPWVEPVFIWGEGNNSGKSPSKVSPLGDRGHVLTLASHLQRGFLLLPQWTCLHPRSSWPVSW